MWRRCALETIGQSKLQVGVCSDLVVFDQLPLRKLMAKQEKQESIVVVMA